MNNIVQKNVSLKELTTFKVGGNVSFFVEIQAKEEIPLVCDFAKKEKLPLVILGGGSNTIFDDTGINACVAKIAISGFSVCYENERDIEIEIGAGENWDEVVKKTVEMNLWGIEAMSAIPGTVGATPVQNVGAYGQEIKDVLVSLEAYDTTTNQFVQLLNSDCQFAYRDSIFKSKEKGRYIITSVVIKLNKEQQPREEYPALKDALQKAEITNPTSEQIRNLVIAIRASKLPDPRAIPNCGSFFENPIVTIEKANELKKEYPTMPSFIVDEKRVKIPAGWLMQEAGLKGEKINAVSVYEKNALVLVNNGEAKLSDVEEAVAYITKRIKEKFGIELDPEPRIVKDLLLIKRR